MKNINKDATVIFTDGTKEHFDAIRITDKGVLIGKIIDGKFEAYGFIPKHNIKEINDGSLTLA
jgi:hypothetical protein